MFPLGAVLVPGMVMPLHVFEPRYRALVQDCQAGDQTFGVVLIERGSEVGGGDQRASVGTLAEMVQVEETPDGRYGLVTVGTHRIRVTEWLEDDPYPRARVEEWPDEPSPDPDALPALYGERVSQLRRLLALAVELGATASALVDVADDPVSGSYHLGMLAGLGPFDHQRLLEAPGVEDRLTLLGDLMADATSTLETQLGS
jgi:Lon protease-like protein